MKTCPKALAFLFAVLSVAAQAPAPRIPTIGEVLTCGRTGTAGGLSEGDDLARYTFDAKEFPNALCNDGSPAILYFRPFQGAENRNRWVIQLQGGGACGSANECAKRWCSVDTNFSMIGMSSTPAPKRGIEGNGILERRADNPLGNFNHVFLKYCSSDKWSGTAKDVIIDADDPITGVQRIARIHFLGSRIVDSALSLLRRRGETALTYTAGTNRITMPSIDDAGLVVLAGASGGAAGVTANLDRLAGVLRRNNVNCQGRPNTTCTLAVRGLHDSSFTPSFLDLDFSTARTCADYGICSSQSLLQRQVEEGSDFLWRSRGDESCTEWHRRNDPDNEWKCGDDTFVVRNTSPHRFSFAWDKQTLCNRARRSTSARALAVLQ